jgi:hypothetical protein
MLSLSDARIISHLEDVYYDPDYYIHKEYDEDEEFNRADEEYAEKYVEGRI